MTSKVSLTFDVDSVALWLDTFRSASPSTSPRSEYDFAVGVPRVLALLERHGIHATFLIPGSVAVLYPDDVRRIQDAGREIASDGDDQGRLVGLSRDEEAEILQRGIQRLTDVTGTRPTGFRAPAWELDDVPYFLVQPPAFSGGTPPATVGGLWAGELDYMVENEPEGVSRSPCTLR